MKIVFIGSVLFSRKMLAELIILKADIVGVISPKTLEFNTDFCDLENICLEHNLSFHHTSQINDDKTYSYIALKHPDIIFCFGWSQLIKKRLLSLAPMGVIGYHPSLLPKNRGRHPIIWALCLGLTETGSTFFFMDAGADSGDILDQCVVSISREDDALSLYNKLVVTAQIQLRRILPLLINRSYLRVPQDHTVATYWRKRYVLDGVIDWRLSAETIFNLVRALTKPYCGAHFMYQGQECKIWKCAVNDTPNFQHVEPGKILENNQQNMVVKCSDKAIKLLDYDSMQITGDYL